MRTMRCAAVVFCLSLTTVLIFGCTPQTGPGRARENPGPTPGKTKENADKADAPLYGGGSLGGTFTNRNQEGPLLTAEPKVDNYLLYGYDVLHSGYIDGSEVDHAYPIIDSRKLTDDDFSRAVYPKSEIDYLFSNNASTLYSDLKVSAKLKNSGAFFSGSIEGDFDLAEGFTEEKTLIKYFQHHYAFNHHYDISADELKSKLTKAFTDAVAKYGATKPEKVFERFGTHLFTQYYTGGRAELSILYTNRTNQTRKSMQAKVAATYGIYSGSASAAQRKQATSVATSSSVKFKSWGGDNLTGEDATEISKQYPAWVKSIKAAPVICGIGSVSKSLLPIWELVDDEAAAAALRAEFDEQATDVTKGWTAPSPLYLAEIGVYSAKKAADAEKLIPESFARVLLNPDTTGEEVLEANKGAGGDYIYLAYRLSTEREGAITDVQVISGDSADVSLKGYTKLVVDLNKGAGGKYIYLFQQASPDAKALRVKELRGVYTDSANSYSLPKGWGWAGRKQDLNEGAGGAFIYLAQSKELKATGT